MGAVHGLFYFGPLRAILNALVQAHNDVGAQALLVGYGQFRGEDVLAAVDVGAEADVVVVHPPEGAHAEGLESTTVGKNRTRPPHELVQAAQSIDRFHPGAQVQVVSVAQDNLGAQVHNLVGRQGLDGGLGSHGHEDGCFYGAVGRGESAGSCPAVPMLDLEGEGGCGHDASLAGWRRRTASRIINIVITMHMNPGTPSSTQSSIRPRKARPSMALPSWPMPMAKAPLSTVMP